MVARGDLGVEMPLDQVPLVQKRAVQLCREQRQAGHRRHPDARLDDRELAADPRRGLRRRQRGARRRRRGDALRRDQRRQVPGRRPSAPWPRSSRPPRPARLGVPRLQHDPRTHGGALTVAAVADRPRPSAPRRWSRSPQTGDTVRRLARLHCELPLLAFTPDAEVRNQLALSWGVETFLVPTSCSTPTTCSARSTADARPRPVPGRATTWSSSPAPRPARARLDQHPAGAPAGHPRAVAPGLRAPPRRPAAAARAGLTPDEHGAGTDARPAPRPQRGT